ncbi:OLC1v1020651C1 [Oldenlandia corymbosa var. corymbosa]|uniref:OLC1v1020651C1 n=1 Tax=Oldenlandia corymbosa var. corymbosa TaxID=529605 RepID=A0AAV1EH45_OLDCO|nr:OLC1v1020651C1 [Oldenlandia corymbosa var. corymbosa]
MGKPQNSSNETRKKRKRAASSAVEAKSKISKKFQKSNNSSEVSQKGSKQPIKLSKPPHVEANPHFNEDDKEKRKKLRKESKELAESRKKLRKKHYTLEQELALLWEKMRRRDITKEDKSHEALSKMKGKIPEIAISHVSSRVLQTCVKYCSLDERNAIFEELKSQVISLATNKYAVYLLNKMLDSASKEQLAAFISSLHGHVATLLRHTVGSLVVEHAYCVGNARQKQSLLMELYSPELRLFKDLASINETRLLDVISKLQLQKSSVSRHLSAVLQPILEKGILDHSIIHKALMEYLTIADKNVMVYIIQQLSGPLLVRMIHTKEGSHIAILCIKHGDAKDRKKIIKGMKGLVQKIALDKYGSMVLVSLLSTVDDTKLLSKIIVREYEGILKEVVFSKSARRPVLQLLHPNCSRYFNPDDLSSFVPSLSSKGDSEPIPDVNEEGSTDVAGTTAEANNSDSAGMSLDVDKVAKKDPLTRRKELLIQTGLAEKTIEVCCEMAGDLLRSQFGKEVIYEVATGGADGILHPFMDEKLGELHEKIASLVGEPKSEEKGETDHLLEDFHSSRTIRKLILDCPAFASKLWEKALQGKCILWAQGHSSKVICAYLKTSDLNLREAAKKELQPLIDSGVLKIPADNNDAAKAE